jgi:hypothetical protein
MNRPEEISSYPRMARRLRARLGDDLHQLHDSLQELARSYDARNARETVESSIFDPMDPPAYFAAMVRSNLTGPVLTYSSRLKLLAQASRLGISRFHANLLIAAVQHENEMPAPEKVESRPKSLLMNAVMVIAVQASIVAAAWMMLA